VYFELFYWYGMFFFLSCSHGMLCFGFGSVLMV
jgi:hypothetical protein